jgi:3' terminal RNA ribose 2'-O-methyltransferase Hen1
VLLTISTTHRPATDLGFLLHKHPDRLHAAELSFGVAHVFYPEATDERCTAAMTVEVDPVDLVRSRKGPKGGEGSLGQYVNDRPYAASSHLCVAINKLFGTALTGRSKERPELADTPIDLEVWLPALPVRGEEDLLARLFVPLGYEADATPLALDTEFPEWGESRYVDARLRATLRIKDLLEHLLVLIPVLDNVKHYWVNADEIDRLLRRGGAWLPEHPECELITRRYLRGHRALVTEALERLLEGRDVAEEDDASEAEEEAVERPLSLNEQRIAAVLQAIVESGARRVVDLGCGSAKLISRLLRETDVEHVVGLDVSYRSLEIAARRLHLDTMTPRQRERVELLHGSLTYRDRRIEGFDAAVAEEVIEHIDLPRLASFERVVFQHAAPRTVIVTTPNREYNANFERLATTGRLRHGDHRFEWTRAEFAEWADGVAARHGYAVVRSGIGPEDEALGAPTQMAVFSR